MKPMFICIFHILPACFHLFFLSSTLCWTLSNHMYSISCWEAYDVNRGARGWGWLFHNMSFCSAFIWHKSSGEVLIYSVMTQKELQVRAIKDFTYTNMVFSSKVSYVVATSISIWQCSSNSLKWYVHVSIDSVIIIIVHNSFYLFGFRPS